MPPRAPTPYAAGDTSERRLEYALNVFDWTVGWTDYALFRRMVDQLPGLGFTTVELGVPWDSVETQPGRYDFSAVDKRVAYVESRGLRLRLRVNVQDYPDWFEPTLMARPDGTTDLRGYGHRTGVPSFFDEPTTGVQRRWVNAVARHYAGRQYAYTLGIGVHFELKYGGWYSYEPPAREAFRRWLAQRYDDIADLNRAWGGDYADFSAVQPPVPATTAQPSGSALPDTSVRNADWIRFREQGLTSLVTRYHRGIRTNDPTARTSAPLGETFRGQSAEFGNQDIAGLAGHADEVVFSYDFFIGGGTESLWNVDAMVKTYADVTGRPVKLEIDGPGTYTSHGPDYVYQAGVRALEAGAAGLNVANYTYERDWVENLGQFEALGRLGDYIRERNAEEPDSPDAPEILYFVSKWTQYAYRSPSEWLHRYQFGLLSLLRDQGIAVRVMTDENLFAMPPKEICDRYRVMILPYDVVLDVPVRERFEPLLRCLPVLQDMRFGETTPKGPQGRPLLDKFGLRPVGQAEPVEALVESTSVLRSFADGDQIRLQGLGQPTASQYIYEPMDDAVDAQASSTAGGVVWVRDNDVRRAVLGYNAGEVYSQGGFKNTTCAVVLDVLRWLGTRVPSCRAVPDITPPVYDFARAAAAARTGVDMRTAGLSAGAAYVADQEALVITPPTGAADGGRTLATYTATVPAEGAEFSTQAVLADAGDGPVTVALVAERANGDPLLLTTASVRSTAPVPIHANFAEVAGELIQLRLSVSSAHTDGGGAGVVRLDSPRILDPAGAVALDLAAEAGSATWETEVESRGLSAGAQFFNLSATGVKVHPPWNGGTGATYAAYHVQLPDQPLSFQVSLAKETAGGDGTEFSATVVDADGAGRVLVLHRVTTTEEQTVTADLTEFAGQTVSVILRIDAGSAENASYDATYLLSPRIVGNEQTDPEVG